MPFKFSNVVGAPFHYYITNQLAVRAFKNSTGYNPDTTRTLADTLFLGNKMAWVRLQSSVEVEDATAADSPIKLLQQDDPYIDEWFNPNWEEKAATEWVLQSGTSVADIDPNNGSVTGYTQRSGLDRSIYSDPSTGDPIPGEFNGAYGLGGIREQGYRPMPGLDSVTIETTGKMGSLKYATIKFKVWNRNQLDIIDMLYFRLGFSMLLEWGHVNYFVNESDTTFTTNTSGVGEYFTKAITKDKIQVDINRQTFLTKGNYDGMLGVVTNYNYALGMDGGWDCTIKLIGLGSILDTQRINNTYTMPEGLAKYYQALAEQAISEAKKQLQEQYEKDVEQAQIDADKQTQANIDAFNAANPIRNTTDLAKAIGSVDPQAAIRNTTRLGYAYNQKFPKLRNKIVANGLDISSTNTDPEYTVTQLISPAYWYTPANGLYVDFVGQTGWFNPLTVAGTQGVSIIQTTVDLLNKVQPMLIINTDTTYGKQFSLGDRYPEIELKNNGNIIYTALNEVAGGSPLRRSSVVGYSGFNINKNTNAADTLIKSPPYVGSLLNKAANTLALNLYSTLDNTVGSVVGKYADLGRSLQHVYHIKAGGIDTDTMYFFSMGIQSINGYNPVIANYQTGIQGLSFKTDRDQEIFAYFLTQVISGWATRSSTDPVYLALTAAKDNGTAAYDVDNNPSPYTTTFTAVEVTQLEPINNAVPPPKWYEYDLVDKITLVDSTGNEYQYTKMKAQIGIHTNMINLIQAIKDTKGQDSPTVAVAKTITPPDMSVTDADKDKVAKAGGIASALEAMLTIVQFETLTATDQQLGKIQIHDLVGTTGRMLKSADDVLFSPLFEPTNNSYALSQTAITNALANPNRAFDPFCLGLKGFNTSIMSSHVVLDQDDKGSPTDHYDKCYPTTAQEVTTMFNHMMNSYMIPYDTTDSSEAGDHITTYLHRPVYIPLGYLLFYINNYCLLYDTDKKTDTNTSRPFFYIDFNWETNKCFTMPSQLSVDPLVAMIPFAGNQADYESLFTTLESPSDVQDIWQVNTNVIGWNSAINKRIQFADDTKLGAYTMHILLNVQHLRDLIKSSTQSDGHNGVYLKPFLDAVLRDVNKALGDNNLLRLAYYDSANTVAVVDDQVVPGVKGEQSFADLQRTVISDQGRFILPVFGRTSIVRDLKFETVTSTKMSSAIAIGATFRSGSAQGIEASNLKGLSNGLYDRVVKIRSEVTDKKNKPKKGADKLDNNLNIASKFNTHVKSVYNLDSSLDKDNINAAKNYLIQSSADLKASNPITSVNPVIPLRTTFTIDGIAGINIGNGFLMPDKIMPFTVRGSKGLTQFGFVVVKVSHKIENNQWLTTVEGAMFKIKDIQRDVIVIGTTNPNVRKIPIRRPPRRTTSSREPEVPATGQRARAVGGKLPDFCTPPYRGYNGERASPYREIRDVYIPARDKLIREGRVTLPKGMLIMLTAHTAQEGFRTKHVAYRSNNPGNIGTDTNVGRINVYPTLEDGIEAQQDLMQRIIDGRSKYYTLDMTIYEYVSVYAPRCNRDKITGEYYIAQPPKRPNDPTRYANFFIGWFKYEGYDITAETTLREIYNTIR